MSNQKNLYHGEFRKIEVNTFGSLKYLVKQNILLVGSLL